MCAWNCRLPVPNFGVRTDHDHQRITTPTSMIQRQDGQEAAQVTRRRRVASCLGPSDPSLKLASLPPGNAHASAVGGRRLCFFRLHDRGFQKDAYMKLDFAWTVGGCLVTMYVSACCWVWVPTSIDACRRNTPTIRAYKAPAWEVSFRTTSSFFRSYSYSTQILELGAKRAAS